MSIPCKAVGGGNNSQAMNVLRVAFSTALSSPPIYQGWDNGSTYPTADAVGSTAVKEAFTGTSGNSSKPEYALVDTTVSAPGSADWIPATATAGSANPNRLKGSTNYVTSDATPAPYAAPGVLTATDSGSGGLVNGAVKYTVTFVVGNTKEIGETLPSTEVSITVSSKQVSLTNIPTGPSGTLKRRIYRTAGGGSTGTGKLLTTLSDNTTTTFTDNVADASLGVAQPTIDTSGSIRFNVAGEFASDSSVPSATAQNILLEVLYQYTGAAPSLTYYVNEGTDSLPSWTSFTPGSHGLRPVNVGTISGNYKLTLDPTLAVKSQELWVTAN